MNKTAKIALSGIALIFLLVSAQALVFSWEYSVEDSELSISFSNDSEDNSVSSVSEKINVEYFIVEEGMSLSTLSASGTLSGKKELSETISLAKKNYSIIFTDLSAKKQFSEKIYLAGLKENSLLSCSELGGIECEQGMLCRKEIDSAKTINTDNRDKTDEKSNVLTNCCLSSCYYPVSKKAFCPGFPESLFGQIFLALGIAFVLVVSFAGFRYWKLRQESVESEGNQEEGDFVE